MRQAHRLGQNSSPFRWSLVDGKNNSLGWSILYGVVGSVFSFVPPQSLNETMKEEKLRWRRELVREKDS